jgi:hypothetical protein
MAKAATKKTSRTPRRSIDEAWTEIAKDEKALIGAATRAVERVPAPADMVDSALLFAARTLKSQREALVPLLDGVTKTGRKTVKPHSPAAVAVSAAYDLAERVVETQRKVLHGLVEAVTPPLARHAPKAHAAVHARPVRRPARKRAVQAS